MTWIGIVAEGDATGPLKKMYERLKGPEDNIDNIMLAHSLRPHTMQGHMALYKNVLHHSGNRIEEWFLEALGVYVSMINGCDYCFDHHYEGMRRLDKTNLPGVVENLFTVGSALSIGPVQSNLFGRVDDGRRPRRCPGAPEQGAPGPRQ